MRLKEKEESKGGGGGGGGGVLKPVYNIAIFFISPYKYILMYDPTHFLTSAWVEA